MRAAIVVIAPATSTGVGGWEDDDSIDCAVCFCTEFDVMVSNNG